MEPSPEAAKRARRDLWVWAVIALAVIAKHVPDFFFPPNRDSGLFAYGGWRILHGALPYAGFWDNKLPGVFYIDALAIKLFGTTQAGLVVFQMIYASLTACLFYAVARKLCSRPAALITTLLLVFYHGSYGLAEDGNYTECYVALPTLLAALLMINWSHDRKGYLIPAIAGALVTIAAIIKQPAAALLAGLILFAIVPDRKRSGFAAAGAVIAGAALPAIVMVLWMAHAHILHEAVEANLAFNRLYFGDAYLYGRDGAILNLERGLAMCALPLAGAIAGIVSLRLRRSPVPSVGWLLVPWFAFDLLGVAMGGRFTNHYFLTLLASAMLLCAVFIGGIRSGKRLVAWTAAGLILFIGPIWHIETPGYKGLPVASIAERELCALQWLVNKRFKCGTRLPFENAAAWVRSHTSEGDLIYVWGWDTRIAFLSHRAFPTRYLHTHPLGATGFNRDARIRELARDLNSHRPRYIVDGSPLLPTTAPSLSPGPTPRSVSPFFRLDGYGPVKQLVARHYKPVAVVDGYVMLQLQPSHTR